MNTSSTESRKPWEELDADLEAHAAAMSADEAEAIDEALELQMISIRLQKSLLSRLKLIASYRGVGYQPLIRDLLNRFARSETEAILDEIRIKEAAMKQLVDDAKDAPAMESVSNFFERERRRA